MEAIFWAKNQPYDRTEKHPEVSEDKKECDNPQDGGWYFVGDMREGVGGVAGAFVAGIEWATKEQALVCFVRGDAGR
jgi:hypothetical protein